jgi:hypothetical protein
MTYFTAATDKTMFPVIVRPIFDANDDGGTDIDEFIRFVNNCGHQREVEKFRDNRRVMVRNSFCLSAIHVRCKSLTVIMYRTGVQMTAGRPRDCRISRQKLRPPKFSVPV